MQSVLADRSIISYNANKERIVVTRTNYACEEKFIVLLANSKKPEKERSSRNIEPEVEILYVSLVSATSINHNGVHFTPLLP